MVRVTDFMHGRTGSVGVVLGLIALALGLVAALTLAISQHLLVVRLQESAVVSCESTERRQESAQYDLERRIDLYDRLIAVEQINPSATEEIRHERVDAYSMARQAAYDRLDRFGPPRDCQKLFG